MAISHARRQGFTLLELIIALSIIVIATGAYLGGTQPNPQHLTGSMSREILASMQHALTEASATGGEAVFYVDINEVGDRRGKFLAVAGDTGVDSTSAKRSWQALTDGVRWTNGNATAGPMGDPVGRVPAEVRCQGRDCWLGGADHTTYYIGHLRNARAVSAIVLNREGTLQIFRYNNANGLWERDAA